MAISAYLAGLRTRVGHDLLVVPSVTAAVLDPDGRLLLAKHRSGEVWATPGGSVDPDETPADAVVREAWEETGLLVEPVRVVGAYGGAAFRVRYPNGDQVSYVMTVFACRVLGGTLRPDGDETLDVRYVARDEIAALKVAAWLPFVLPDVFARGGGRFTPPAWRPAAG